MERPSGRAESNERASSTLVEGVKAGDRSFAQGLTDRVRNEYGFLLLVCDDLACAAVTSRPSHRSSSLQSVSNHRGPRKVTVRHHRARYLGPVE